MEWPFLAQITVDVNDMTGGAVHDDHGELPVSRLEHRSPPGGRIIEPRCRYQPNDVEPRGVRELGDWRVPDARNTSKGRLHVRNVMYKYADFYRVTRGCKSRAEATQG